jgi:hypothetical protein
MFNIFQYEKINRTRKMNEIEEAKKQKDDIIHAAKTKNLSSQANLRRLDWAIKYLNPEVTNSIL